MIEAAVTCDRCGKTGGDGKMINRGLSIASKAEMHLCAACGSAFDAWLSEYRRKEKAA